MTARLLAGLAFVVFAFLASLTRAQATSEYCPARLLAYHESSGGGPATYAFVLSAASTRIVHGTLLAQTDAGWFTIPFTDTRIAAYDEHYHNAYIHWSRTEYYSPVMYVRFPQNARLIRWTVLQAQSSGDKVFHWDQKGAVTCRLQTSDAENVESPETSAPSALGAIREGPAPYDLLRAPGPSDAMLTPAAADVTANTQCSKPFDAVVATTKLSPRLPANVGGLNQALMTIVEVAVSADGAPDDAWIYQPSGVPALDDAVLAAARGSTYRAARSFCEPSPGFYRFVITFQPG